MFTFRFGRMSFPIQPVRCADSVDSNDGTDTYIALGQICTLVQSDHGIRCSF